MKCVIDGCHKMGRSKGKNFNGESYYGLYCDFHHKTRSSFKEAPLFRAQATILNDKCERCGWDEAYCDRHRIQSEIGYTRSNVRVLCPNCHRLATIGKITFT